MARRQRRMFHREKITCATETLSELPELLGLIFLHTLHPGDFQFPARLLSLTYVCSYWRAVALQSPELWTGLRFRCLYSCSEADAIRHKVLIQHWVHHSGKLPISIHARYRREDIRKYALTSSVFAVLLPHSYRWRHINIMAPGYSVAAICRTIGSNTPCLEHFVLICGRTLHIWSRIPRPLLSLMKYSLSISMERSRGSELRQI